MAFAYQQNGQWVEVNGPFVVGDLQYPYNWPDLASDEERAAIGVKEIIEPSPVAANAIVTGSTINDVGGAPHRVWITRTIVPQQVERVQGNIALAEAGKYDQVNAWVAANGDAAAKRYWADTPIYRRDSQILIGLWHGFGGTDAELDALFTAAAQVPLY